MVKLALMDRDGVLNEDRPHGIVRPQDLILLPGAAAALARLNAAGWQVAVVTNQSVIGRGLVSSQGLAAIHARLMDELSRAGARVDAVFFCPDHPDRPSERRKPSPGMLREALERFGANADQTPMIGDALRDLEAAAKIGCPRILVRTGKGSGTEAEGLPDAVQPVTVVDDLDAAVDFLLKKEASK